MRMLACGYVLEELHSQFKDAPVLGSLINPERGMGKRSLLKKEDRQLSPLLNKALNFETRS